jgi:hypothetical protein
MGVFLQPDPIGFKGDAANLYRFCSNNAVNRIDPLGLEDEYFSASPEMVRLSVQATKHAARTYAQARDLMGRAVWGAKRRDGAIENFSVKGVRKDQVVFNGPRRMVVGHEYERTPDLEKIRPGVKFEKWVYNGHIHGRRGDPEWSKPDTEAARKGIVVTKANWNDLDKNGNLLPGHDVKRLSGVKNGNPVSESVYTAPSNGSASSSPSSLTAAQIDAAHQALGVPSLGAEAVNFISGRR